MQVEQLPSMRMLGFRVYRALHLCVSGQVPPARSLSPRTMVLVSSVYSGQCGIPITKHATKPCVTIQFKYSQREILTIS